MGSLKKITLTMAALLASTAFVNAADIFVPETHVEVVPETKVHHSGGWYLRGDVGYGKVRMEGSSYVVNRQRDILDPTYDADYDDIPGVITFNNEDMTSSWSIGAGVGYQIDDIFRVDVTANHFMGSNLEGSSGSGNVYDCDYDPLTDTDCLNEDSASFAATLLLANAYADLGTYSGLTPYVGAGIGGAYVKWGDLKNDQVCSGADCGAIVEADSVHPGENGWRFAYGLHGGASYDLSAKMKVDVGYSFNHISGGNMFGFRNNSYGVSGVQGQHGDIKIHQVRAGLRYSLN